jgi:glycosyltransferase involved in cell wall biosynthesis
VNPELGGVPASVVQLNQALEEMGVDSQIVTLDEPTAPFLARLPGRIHPLGPAVLKYGFTRRLVPWLEEQAPSFDAMIVHGIWQYPAPAVRRAARRCGLPYFVYPHGQLNPWFKERYRLKHLKKWLYWPWASYRVLRDARAVIYTSDEERRLARRSFWLYRAREAVTGIGIADPFARGSHNREESAALFFASFPSTRDRRLLIHLGRLHPSKGCDLLIQAFSQAAATRPELHLVMAGPDQQGWRRELEEMARRAGCSEAITWTDMLEGEQKWAALHAADALVLPSHSDNFGLVVAEAIACGLPVLLSDKVNISPIIARSGAGLVEVDTLEGTLRLLEKWLSLSEDEAAAMGLRARECFERHYDIKHMAEALVRLVERELTAA